MIEYTLADWTGKSRWLETEATVYSSEQIADGKFDDGPPSTRLVFYYRDHAESLQSGDIVVDSLTPLYRLRAKETFQIRFNPRKPSQFYCSEAASPFSQFRLAFWVGFATVTVILILRFLQSHHLRWS
ncbi:hypothetical protein [Granulicella arctica]|uniref:hypothetical protein n=1 Tax=Granulicella arctica TaxID=940613 RepID=UPI0021DF4F66|nr:hypothetical protein [Granulicella arctica]